MVVVRIIIKSDIEEDIEATSESVEPCTFCCFIA